MLCRAAGINCKSMEGRVVDGPGEHIWNILETADGVRYVDVTFMDSNIEKYGTAFDYEHFMLDEELFLLSGYQPYWDSLE